VPAEVVERVARALGTGSRDPGDQPRLERLDIGRDGIELGQHQAAALLRQQLVRRRVSTARL
jgi:hypothetical protein